MHDAVADLVELVKTFKSKNKLAQVMMSTLFKQRQAEADAVIDNAMSRLQVSHAFDRPQLPGRRRCDKCVQVVTAV